MKKVNAKVLFIITARGGSKGVPHKNIKEIDKIPLVAYKIIAAQRCNCTKKRIIVSTDDHEIEEISKKYGAEVPFIRPNYLAQDDSSSMDVINHALSWVDKNDVETYDYICVLEPSSPFATGQDLQDAFLKLQDTNADTLLGMKETEVNTCFIDELDADGGLSAFYEKIKNIKDTRRQAQTKQYTMNGCMYIAKMDYFRKNSIFHSIHSIPYIMPAETSIEIDNMLDYYFACFLVEKGIIDTSFWK